MLNELLHILIGLICLFLGPYLFLYIKKLRKEKKIGTHYYRYTVYGIAVFIFGIILIIRGIILISLL